MFRKLLFVGGTTITTAIAYNCINFSENFKSVSALTQNSFDEVKKWNHNWDNVNFDESKKSKATRHIILIRHGQYVQRENDTDCKLTLIGRDQAKYTGFRLKEMGIEYDKLIHSTMTRAEETAKIISQHIPSVKITLDDELIEGAPYVSEPPNSWNLPDHIIEEDNSRIEKAFKKYFHRARPDQEKDSYEILVCHANVIRYFICRALQFPPEGWIRFSLDNGSMSWIFIKSNGTVGVRSVGNSGFMPPNKITVE